MREQEVILNRLAELHIALQWSTEHAALEISTALTVGQRIMVNQERAALFREWDGKQYTFKQSAIVEEKLIRILYIIRRTKWQPKE